MLAFFSISRSPLGEAGEELFVGQFSPIELHLNLDPVHPDVASDPEGDAVLDPGLGGPALGQLPLEVLALVVGGVSGQQVLSPDQLRRGAQLSTVLSGQLDPDLGEPAPLGAGTVELKEGAQLSEGQLLGVQAAAEHKPERVHMGGAAGAVSGHHLGHSHGSNPLSMV